MLEYSKDIQERLKRGMGCWTSEAEELKGWLPIIEDLNETLRQIAPDYVIDQIKEKFGSLRYYITLPAPEKLLEGLWERAYDEIDKAERLSERTCVECGEVGSIQKVIGSYVLALCEEHLKERRESRAL